MLPVGILVAADIFQEAMGCLFLDLGSVIVYIDDIIILGDSSLVDHLKNVTEVLKRLSNKGMQINSTKSSWSVSEVDYLGFTITREGIKPQRKKVQRFFDLKPPANIRQVRGFVGMVNYYKELRPKRSMILTPLTKLTGRNSKFEWTDECQTASVTMKKIMAQDVLLMYPEYGNGLTYILTDVPTRLVRLVHRMENQ